MFRRCQLLVLVLLVTLVSILADSCPAAAESRLALIIGNGKYQRITPLDNPVNDAKLMAETLNKQGFDVAFHMDLDLKAMKRALQVFYGKVQAAGKGAIALVYYAGHGVQVKGVNYLIPVDAEIEREGDVDIEAVRADSIMEMIANASSPLNIVIIDACRNNPYRGFRSAARGLAQIDAPTGTLVAFSTAPGRVATDGPKGGNSPYSAALAKALMEPGLRVEDVFKRVRQAVNSETQGLQVPWESSSLVGDFYPAGRSAPGTIASPPQAAIAPIVSQARSIASAMQEIHRETRTEHVRQSSRGSSWAQLTWIRDTKIPADEECEVDLARIAVSNYEFESDTLFGGACRFVLMPRGGSSRPAILIDGKVAPACYATFYIRESTHLTCISIQSRIEFMTKQASMAPPRKTN